jgi:NAD(P)H-hydrate epimerase
LLFSDGKENSGDLYVVPIGIDDGLIEKYDDSHRKLIDVNDVRKLFPKRKKASYKYSNGKVLVIAGSKGLSGAAAMCSISALKSGAGAVVAAIPYSISSIFNKKLFDIISLELDETSEGSIALDNLIK